MLTVETSPLYQYLAINMQPTRKPRFDEAFCIWGWVYRRYPLDVCFRPWPFNNLDDIFEIIEEDLDLTKQNEFILSRKVLPHWWAGAFSVMYIMEHATFEDIAKAQKRGIELWEAKYPEEKDRDARDKKIAALAGHGMHEDSILQENTKLTK